MTDTAVAKHTAAADESAPVEEATVGDEASEANEAAEAPFRPARFRLGALPAGLLRNARPRQWVKNVLVLAAPGAAGLLDDGSVLKQAAVVFVLFCAAASGIYFINDALDVEADRAHPVKRNRPIAAGIVPLRVAYAAGAVLGLGALAGALLLCNVGTAIVLGTYLAMQLLYCTKLKHALVADLAFVTSGFVLRAMIGGVAAGIPLSRWFLITTGFGSLFMVAAKRYSELVLMGDQAAESRKLLASYSTSYLRFVWQASASIAVLAYCLWALADPVNQDTLWRQLSIVPFVFAILRYALFADRGTAGAPEDVVLKDRALLGLGLVWGILYAFSVVGL
ncbi:decaprenyl-phosphate phosphoribosyltransferase [Kitasatospora sp. GP82]|uniref:decaprenyl-phosphate phosphoribosyltransferase n=1 Tax=Kitasatospora sp. GP82 TaxID=3035089 RepID=UPI0024733AAC|nr:decaprenyl-phosphate phosphoribosyltransferase [Kitasatospora sp. GP82]MDH6124192.1 decaprenyl-phosphate phosphoribosyltransferase [Kitasatospora sp. GP82]